MAFSKVLRTTVPELIPVAVFFLVELTLAVLTGARLPVGVLPLAVSLGVVFVGGFLGVLLLSSSRIPIFLLPPLVSGILAAKLWLVAGSRGVLVPLVVLVLSPLVVLVVNHVLTGRAGSRSGWSVLVVLAAILSTDAIQTLWLWTGGRGDPRLGAALLILGGIILALGSFLQAWPILREVLKTRPIIPWSLLSLLVLGIGGLWWWNAPGPTQPSLDVRKAAKKVSPESLPDVILISVDTLRWDMVPPRARHVDLPHLERLVEDSIDFTRGYSTSSWSLPAHASLLSGLLPMEHGGLNHRSTILEDVTMYPERLRRLGYRTAGFAGGILLDRRYGFDRGFDVYWNHGDPAPVIRYRDFVPGGLEGVLTVWPPGRGQPPIEIRHRFRSDSPVGIPGEHRFEPNLELAREWLRTGSDDIPFFLFLHTYEVHERNLDYEERLRKLKREHPELARVFLNAERDTGSVPARPISPAAWTRFVNELPAELPERSRRRFDYIWTRTSDRTKSIIRERLGGFTRQQKLDLLRWMVNQRRSHWRQFWESSRETKRGRVESMLEKVHRGKGKKDYWRARKLMYGYRIENVDESLGRFLDWLRKRGEYEDSMIVFLSDHGEGFRLDASLHGHAKSSLEEAVVRVPFWIKLPGNRRGGESIPPLISLQDVFPLLYKNMGLPVPCPRSSCEHRSFREVPGLTVPERDYVQYSIETNIYSDQPFPNGEAPVKMGVGTRRFKQVHASHTETDAVFTVHPEKLRQHRVAPSTVPEHVRKQLQEAMDDYERIRREAPETSTRELEDDLRDELRGAGYL